MMTSRNATKFAKFLNSFAWRVVKYEKEGSQFTPCVIYVNRNGTNPRVKEFNEVDTGVVQYVFHNTAGVYSVFATSEGIMSVNDIRDHLLSKKA